MNAEERNILNGHRMEKSKNTLNEIPVLIQNEFYLNAVNRLYYSSFYAVSALLIKKQIQSKTHNGTKQMFGLHFIKTGIISQKSGEFYTLIFELRQTGDYDDYIVFTKEEVIDLLNNATELIAEIESVLLS